ncbi:SRPBCC family protein [Streptomyces sp. ISL-98]|uniref:SRPBCC family protein n=1 Tax=Streptomyces sp. ISL-98 TaxID=2819192 RepID=UPI001BE57884|nr:SRPBCC family protein [Streptomyces sp. ISL-98]MBT2508958.1 SRPBCC family protein [Streptomyces sp. ISL-98]
MAVSTSAFNVHERLLPATASEVGALIDTLATPGDLLWPGDDWPRMSLDNGLTPGSKGGHGPVRYTVTSYVPDKWVRFTFSGPRGFDGFHELTVHAVDDGRTVLRHTLAMKVRGPALLTWPLMYRSCHDAVLEDALDRAESALTGKVARPARWSWYVRLLRRLAPR